MPEENVMATLQKFIKDNGQRGVEEILGFVEQTYGMVPFVTKVLSQRPDLLIPYVLKGLALYRNENSTLDSRIKELFAVTASAALRCDYCLETHIHRAKNLGATMPEVLEAISIAGSIAEASVHAHALRKYYQIDKKEQ